MPNAAEPFDKLRTGFVEAPDTDPCEEKAKQMLANAFREAPQPDAAGCRVIVLPIGAAAAGAKARAQASAQGDDANTG